jgi:ribose transport system ATP-binding protein
MNMLEMRGIEKSFGSMKALTSLDFSVRAGEVRGLMGTNGAGKSTLMKILSGIYQMDAGEITIDERPVVIRSPEMAERLGIAIVHQEFSLVPHLSVGENIFLSRLPISNRLFKTFDRKRLVSESQKILDSVGIALDPEAVVADLSLGQQQLVEIARAVSLGQPRIVIFDEPTSALNLAEIERLFSVVRTLKTHGLAIVYVTHRLNEFEQICDSVSVVRDGKLIGTYLRGERTLKELIGLMLGREEEIAAVGKTGKALLATTLELEGVRGQHFAGPVSLRVRQGEIVGLVGQMGSGRTEVLKTIVGIDRKVAGEIRFGGQALEGGISRRIGLGIGFVAEDRKREGLLKTRDLRENVAVTILRQLSPLGFLSSDRERREFSRVIQATLLSHSNHATPITQLSGGNQQKVMIGRWLALKGLKLLLLDEPTRGVDVGARYQIYSLLQELAEEGVAILVASSDIEEILTICGQVVLMRGGSSREIIPTKELNRHSLTYLVSGGSTGAKV